MTVSVLIADDDPNIVMALRFLMEKEGYDVDVATDGDSAIASVGRRCPDIVLLDVMMPRRNGIDVCAAIRADPRTAWTCVVMLTAKGMDRERNRGMKAGADEYITKPFSTRDVIERVRLLVQSSRARRDSVDRGAR